MMMLLSWHDHGTIIIIIDRAAINAAGFAIGSSRSSSSARAAAAGILTWIQHVLITIRNKGTKAKKTMQVVVG